MPDEQHEHEHDADGHEHEHDTVDAAGLREANVEELKKAVRHLTTRNAARETLLKEIERTRPDPIEVQAARLEMVIALLVPGELERLWMEYQWQIAYARILTNIEKSFRPPGLKVPSFNGSRGV